jgi:thiol-disulfide isomerase/thioredoxin
MISKLRFFLFLLSTFFSLNNSGLLAQKTFTIDYVYKETNELPDSFYFGLHKPVVAITMFLPEKRSYPMIKYQFVRIDSQTAESICTYQAEDTSCSTIADGFGYETFVVPGDTVNVFVEKKTKIAGSYWINQQKGYRTVWFHNFLFSGKNKYIYSLFDSLAYYTGMVQFASINFEKADYRLGLFFKMVTDNYNTRLNYLNYYCILHNIPISIKKLAAAEIRSAYIINLAQPMANVGATYTIKDYPKAYLDSLVTFDNLHDAYLSNKTMGYMEAVYEFISLYDVKLFSGDTTDEALFQNRYRTISHMEEGYSTMSENLLSYCLEHSLKKKYSSYRSFLNEFGNTFPNSESFKYLDSLYKIEEFKPKVSLDEALATIILDSTGKSVVLKDILIGKPVLIDCWASWCIPCLNQMPFEKELEKKYGNKIDFVYLSFDRDRSKWSTKNEQLQLMGKSYLLTKNFSSDFANYLNIESIPRYLLFDKNGKLVNPDAPRPSKLAALNKLLDHILEN